MPALPALLEKTVLARAYELPFDLSQPISGATSFLQYPFISSMKSSSVASPPHMMQGLEAESGHQVCQEILTILVHQGVKPQSTLPLSHHVILHSRSRPHVTVNLAQHSYHKLSPRPDTGDERLSSDLTASMRARGMPSHCEFFATSISSSCSMDVHGMCLTYSVQNAFLLC